MHMVLMYMKSLSLPQIDIPETMEGSFYRGQVHVGLKDAVFQASSPLPHATELKNILEVEGTCEALLHAGLGFKFTQVEIESTYVFGRNGDSLQLCGVPPGNLSLYAFEKFNSLVKNQDFLSECYLI